MKYRVIKAFIDRLTNSPYNADNIYETDDTKRAKELAAAGYILLPDKQEEPKKPETASESDTGEPEGEEEAAKATTKKGRSTSKKDKEAAK